MFALLQRLSLFLVGVTLPMQGYSFLDFSFGMTPFKLATMLLLAVALLQFGLTRAPSVPDRKRLWMLAFLASFVLSCVTSFLADTKPMRLFVVFTTYVSLALYYLAVGYVVRTQRNLELVLWALIIGGAITAAPAFLGVQQGSDIGVGERFTGLAGQANLLGFDMAICFPIGLAVFFGARSTFRRLAALVIATACVAGLFLSLSRSAIVSLGAMGVFWFARAGLAGSVRYIVPGVILTVALALLAPESVMLRMESIVDPVSRAEDGSIQSRVGQVEWALRAIASNPLVGVGVLRFIPWAQEQRGGLGQHLEVHNAYLGVAVEQGLLGLVPYLALLALTWGDYARCLRELRGRRALRDPSLNALEHLVTFMQIALLGSMIGGVFGMAQKSKTTWLLMALSPVVLALARERVRELGTAAQPALGLERLALGPRSVPFGTPTAG
jgi:O-antigen ligase